MAIYALGRVVDSSETLIEHDVSQMIETERMRALNERKSSKSRGYMLTGDEALLVEVSDTRNELRASIAALVKDSATDEARRLLAKIDEAEREHDETSQSVLLLRKRGEAIEQVALMFDERALPKRRLLDEAIGAFSDYQTRRLQSAVRASSATAASAETQAAAGSALVVLLSIAIAIGLTRTLGRQIGGAVGQVQSSSSELQAAANQQATSSREQATAMTEIATTIGELLMTSKRIAESAGRVAQVAEETAAGARAGSTTIERGTEATATIRRQVDLIASHMLELGRKSQQIGAVLDIVSELAEQTNILAINATIEAAGAGEAGKRFAVVADEIRKLADRVGGSTKEIRSLIEDVRSAVNTTVMTTETGVKAADAGGRQFLDVASTFKQIQALVTTTTEASREIELSTKQQATAVEQVNVAIANVAQATRETEASSAQTLQTASQLAGLSRDMARLVQANTAS
jgi:methyl-accepting chemotaxis protein